MRFESDDGLNELHVITFILGHFGESTVYSAIRVIVATITFVGYVSLIRQRQ